MRQILLLFILSFLCVVSAPAASTVECHCFQERQYQPEKSQAADPYFLATTQNSLMSVMFQVDKKVLVRAKMSGSDGQSLWIASYLADQSGKSLSDINRVRSASDSWKNTVLKLKIKSNQLDSGFVELLNETEKLADYIVDDALITRLQAQRTTLFKLRQRQAGNQELILAVFLGRVSGVGPERIYAQFVDGESWGKLLYDQGLFDGAAIEKKWSELLTR